MLIDVVFNNDTQWTVNKSFESIRLMLERIGKTSHLFSQDYKEQHD